MHPALKFSFSGTGHRRLPAVLASDSDSEAESDSSSSEGHSQSPQTKRGLKTAAASPLHGLENALVVWKFESVARELMDAEAAQQATEYARDLAEQGVHEQDSAMADCVTIMPQEHAATQTAENKEIRTGTAVHEASNAARQLQHATTEIDAVQGGLDHAAS